MRFLNFKRVLCLSPHPDDVEYSMAGSILKYKDTKFDLFCLSCGGAKGFDETNKLDCNNVRNRIQKSFCCSTGSNPELVQIRTERKNNQCFSI